LPFENTLAAEPPLPPAPLAKPVPGLDFKQPMVLGIAAGLVLVVILIGGTIFVLARRRTPAPVAVDTAPVAVSGAAPAKPVLIAGETAEKRMENLISAQEAQQAELEAEALSRIKLPANTKQTEVLIRHIRDSVTKDAASSTNVLRTWISDLDAKRTS
jgi:flagellar biosynthesis/type III secretory pathway M-ring protein FliF/YscJ